MTVEVTQSMFEALLGDGWTNGTNFGHGPELPVYNVTWS